MVQAHRTSSNLLKLHPHRDSKVYRLLIHEFGVVRLDRIFSDYIFTGDIGVQGVICTSLMRFKHIEPHRTFSNYILTEMARYIDFFHTSSGWFDCTEPPPTTSLQGIQGVQGAICTGSVRFKHIEPHRTFSNYILTEMARYIDFFHTSSGWFDWTEPPPTTSLKGMQGVQGAICTGLGRFKHIEPHRTFSIHILTKIARYIDFFHTSSGWFDWTEPPPTTSLKGMQGVQGAICTGLGRFKHIEPHRTFSNYILTEIKRYIEFLYMSSGRFDCTEPSISPRPATVENPDLDTRPPPVGSHLTLLEPDVNIQVPPPVSRGNSSVQPPPVSDPQARRYPRRNRRPPDYYHTHV